MDQGQYHRDAWGYWWYEQPDGTWFRHDGVSWVPSAPLHPWYWAAQPQAVGRRGGRRTRNWALLGTGAVVLVVAAVLLAALLQPATGAGSSSGIGAPADPTIVHEVTHIPVSVYDQVGSGDEPVEAPTVTQGHPALTVDGKPGLFFFLAEYCPYCATERWAIVAALSRFGTWQGLRNMASSASDVYPDTQTFTFRSATYTSRYIGVDIEEAVDRSDQPLQRPTPQEESLLTQFNVQGFPFIDIGNRVLVSGVSFSPGVVAGLSRAQIAADLNDPSDAATGDIVATANYLSAGICAVDGQQPSSVCRDPAVTTAAAELGLAT